MSELTYEAETEAIAVTLTREELEAEPEYDPAGQESLPADTQLTTLMGGADASSPAAEAPADPETDLDGPVTEAPAMEAPPTDGATTEAPMNNAPVADAPATDEVPQTGTETDQSTTTD